MCAEDARVNALLAERRAQEKHLEGAQKPSASVGDVRH